MKKIILLWSIFLASVGMISAQEDYYWYKGQKVPVTENSKKKYVVFKNEKSNANAKSFLGSSAATIRKTENKSLSGTWRKYKGKTPKVREHAIVELKQNTAKLSNEEIYYEASFYKPKNGEEAPLSNLFFVKLKDSNDVAILDKLATTYHAEILGNNQFMPLWYTLSANKESKGNALKLANLFYESGYFAAAEPEFLFPFKSNCKNDNLFSQQWGLNNTGQSQGGVSGIDIKACQAWQVTQGSSNVVVAVVDEGVQLNHPDLNISTTSFDAQSGTSPSKVTGGHGTGCAGIISAKSNNTTGVAGIAPLSPLMSVSIEYATSAPSAFADAINYAWQHGAAVISNSWYYEGWNTTIIDDAIEAAITSGRNGLGTVVVFSAGNTDGAVSNPADNNPKTIVVGAMSPCGKRKSPSSCDGETWWGSSYGSQVDVVAPGVLIPTTMLNSSYTTTFNGTSAAAPHVAGLAALLISVKPNLTQQQVANYIEQSAQKVGGYAYAATSGRTNGTWHNEMGYGLIDAKKALDLATGTTSNLLTKYGVPRATAIPVSNFKYSKVHVLGSGGPNLSNVFNSIFNWQGSASQPNGLYQFTLETTNGIPRSYTNIPNYGTYKLHTASPEITINSSIGFAGLAGSYWVTFDGNNLVLVAKSGAYALYFSNSSTPPSARQADASDMSAADVLSEVSVYPNPFASQATIQIPAHMGLSTIQVTNGQGQPVETLQAEGEIVLGETYTPGLYHVQIIGATEVKKASILKQ